MDRLSIYMARQLAVPYAFVLLALVSLIIVIPSLRLIDVVLSKGLPLEVFVRLLVAYAPRDLAFASPFLVFLATASAYGRLSMDSELIALQAAGRSNWHLLRPALAFGAIAGAVTLLLEVWVAPAGYHSYREQLHEVRSGYAYLLPQEATFLSPVQGVTLFVRERETDGTLRGLLFHDGRNPEHPVSIVATEGHSRFSDGRPRFVVYEGSRYEVDPDDARVHALSFGRYTFDVEEDDHPGLEARRRSTAELPLWDLLDPPADSPDSLRAQYRAEAHRRIQSPLFLLLMTLAGVAPFLFKSSAREHPLRPLLPASVAAVVLEILYIAAPWTYASFALLIPVSYGLLGAAICGILVLARRHRVGRTLVRMPGSPA